MKKYLAVLVVLLITSLSFGQQERDLKLNKETNLIEVTYYHENGVISQTGAYTTDGSLQGEWLSYNPSGEKIVSAQYDHGQKVGKWFYWTKETLKEVDYTNNAIVSVNEWSNKSSLAIRN